LAIRFPAGGERSPHFAEQFLSSIRPMLAGRALTLVVGHCAGRSGLFLRAPTAEAPFVQRQLLAAYPDCTAEPVDEARLNQPNLTRVAEFRLAPSVLPLATQRTFEDALRRELVDPLAAVLVALSDGGSSRIPAWLEITIVAADSRRARRARRFIERVILPRRWGDWPLRKLLALSGKKGGILSNASGGLDEGGEVGVVG
jgi:hypothetical protein